MFGKEIVGRLKRFVDKLNGDNMTVDEAIAWAKAWTVTRDTTVEMAWVKRITDSIDLSQVQFLPGLFVVTF